MKAILQYGQFTSMIELPTVRDIIQIVKPIEAISLAPLDLKDMVDVTQSTTTRLEFQYYQQISSDLFLYRFTRER